MWTIKNNIIPFKGFKDITIWPFVFVRKDAKYTTVDARHECVHGKQQVEMLVLPFLLWYLIEWAIKSIKKGKSAYRDISFEREAYTNENDLMYIKTAICSHHGSIFSEKRIIANKLRWQKISIPQVIYMKDPLNYELAETNICEVFGNQDVSK